MGRGPIYDLYIFRNWKKKSMVKMARETGAEYATIRLACIRLGVKPPAEEFVGKHDQYLKDNHLTKSVVIMADIRGTSDVTIRKAMKRLGLPELKHIKRPSIPKARRAKIIKMRQSTIKRPPAIYSNENSY